MCAPCSLIVLQGTLLLIGSSFGGWKHSLDGWPYHQNKTILLGKVDSK